LGFQPLRHRCEYAAFGLVTRALPWLPRPVVRRFGRLLGRFYGVLDRRRRKLMEDNLAQSLPALDRAQRRRVMGACFGHLGATFLETYSVMHRDPATVDRSFDVSGWEHIEALETSGRGYFLLSGHYGGPDLGTYPLAHRLGRLHLVIRPFNNPLIWAKIQALRERSENVIIDKHRAGHKMLTAVRRGARVGLQIDQRVAPGAGILVPFLGRPAWTTPVLAYLSIHAGVPVVPVFSEPVGKGRHLLRIEPPIYPEGRGAAAEAELTRRYLEPLERAIRRRPELWMWMHSRWRLAVPVHSPRARARLRAASGLPEGKGLAALAAPEREAVASLVGDGFLEACGHAVLDGEVAEQAAIAVGQAVLEAGHSIRFAQVDALVEQRRRAAREQGLADFERELDRQTLLIVVGFDDPARMDDQVRAAVCGILAQRKQRRASVLAGRQALACWAQTSPDAAVAPGGRGSERVQVTVLDDRQQAGRGEQAA